MRHPDEGTIHAWLDGALDDAETAWIDAHTRECPACGALVAEARGLVAGASRVLGALDAVPGGVVPVRHEPTGSGEVTTGRVIRRFAGRTHVEGTSRWMAPVRAAAALLLVAGGTAVIMRSADMPAMMELGEVPGDTESVVAVPATTSTGMATGAAASAAASVAANAGVTSGADAAADGAVLPESAARAEAAAAPAVAATPVAPSATVEDRRAMTTLGGGARRVASRRALAAAVPPAAPPAARDAGDAGDERRVERKLLEATASAIGRPASRAPGVTAPLVLRPAPDSLTVPPTEVVVVGVVRDERTGEPVVGASVRFDDGDIGTITDDLGRFTITGTTTGVHRAQVRRMGYTSAVREVRVVGDSSVLDLRLAPSGTSIAAVLGEGYTDVRSAPGRGVAGGSAKATEESPPQARPVRPGTRTESAADAERGLADSARTSGAPPSAPAPEHATTAALPSAGANVTGERSRVLVPLATKVPAGALRRSTQRDAAGSCLTIALSPVGSPDAARTVAVRLLPAASRDTALEGTFAVEFPRAGDVPGDARGSWTVVPRAAEDERSATGVQLHWVAGGEEVRATLDWSRPAPEGRASVRRGGVGVDARATATRLDCRAVRQAP